MSKNCSDWLHPIAGIGQGNSAGPPIWVAVSTPLFQALNTDRFITTFICTLSAHQQTLVGFGFVDDSNLCVNDHTNKVEAIAWKMQQSLNLWAGCLCTTGGAVMPKNGFGIC